MTNVVRNSTWWPRSASVNVAGPAIIALVKTVHGRTQPLGHGVRQTTGPALLDIQQHFEVGRSDVVISIKNSGFTHVVLLPLPNQPPQDGNRYEFAFMSLNSKD